MSIELLNKYKEIYKKPFSQWINKELLNQYRNIEQMYNLGQKAVDKFAKLSTIGFSTEYFTAGFFLFTKKRQTLALGWPAEYFSSNPSISAIFIKFPNFLKSWLLSLLATRILIFWWK